MHYSLLHKLEVGFIEQKNNIQYGAARTSLSMITYHGQLPCGFISQLYHYSAQKLHNRIKMRPNCWLKFRNSAAITKRSWLEWILQNQVSARRLELNKIIFRQIAPTLHDLVQRDKYTKTEKGQDANGYFKIWIKAYIEVSCFSRSFCKNLVQGANNVCLITVPRLPCKAYS